jgi:phage protein D
MVQQAIPIYQGQDFYVPAFQVKLRGRPVGQDVIRDVIQVSYKDSLDNIDSFELTVNNWDAEKKAFKYSDTSLFDPGTELSLEMGYHGSAGMQLMLTGEITSLRPTFPASGQPTLAVSGLNLLHRFRKKQETHVYEKMTDSEIARQIAGRLGVTPITSPSPAGEERHTYLIQDNRYDIIFLLERARRIGYELLVQETGGQSSLYFGPSINVRQLTYQLTYGRSLIQFQPDLTTANQVAKVTVEGWDAVKKQKIKVTVDRSQLAIKSQPVSQNAFADREEVITDKPVNSVQEAQTLARETLERNAKDMIKASGSTVGLPDLRTGSIMVIDGLGQRFSGRYFVTATTHAIGSSGYVTQFECRREEL